MDLAVVINPASGKGKGARTGADVVRRLTAGGATVKELAGPDAESSLRLCHEAVAAGTDALVAVGGDGMVHLALQAVAGTGTPLGIVPAGTGNDLAAHLGLSGKDVPGACDVVLAGRRRVVDAVRVGERWFGCVLGAGFDSACNERANQLRWPRGDARYLLAIAMTLPGFQARHFTLDLDGETWEAEAMLVALGNARSYGGGMRVVPDAVIDDGLLDVFVLDKVGKLEFLRTFPRVFKGTHLSHPAVHVRRARKVTIDSPGVVAYADGERLGPLPLTCEVIPGALTVLTPSS